MQLKVLDATSWASSARTTSASWASPPERRTAAPLGDAATVSPKRASTSCVPREVAPIGGDRLHARAPDLGLERIGRPLGDDPSVVDDPHAVREHVGLLEVLGREEDRDAAVGGESLHLRPERAAALQVEAGGGLVEEKDARPVHERERQVEPPLHAPRVAADLAVGRLGEAHPLEQRVTASPPLLTAHAVEGGLQLHVLASGEERIERRLLEGRPDRGADRRTLAAPRRVPPRAPCPTLGGSRVVSMCTVVDLPAPLGPRKP